MEDRALLYENLKYNMAEGGESWWGAWLQSAKEKSSNVLEFMKRDVDEFTHTFQRETKTVVSNATNALKSALQIDDEESTTNQVKRSVSSFLGSVTQVFTPSLEENEDELCIIHNSEPIIMDRMQTQLYNLRSDPKTYLEDPESIADYEEWIREFELENKQTDLSNILISSVEVQNMYTKLVPLSVSHVVFWHRYFYKLYKLYEAEDRKKALMLRANTQGEEIQWDDEDGASNVEISEQMADLLLSDYEKECNERKKMEDENRNYSKNFIKMQPKYSSPDDSLSKRESSDKPAFDSDVRPQANSAVDDCKNSLTEKLEESQEFCSIQNSQNIYSKPTNDDALDQKNKVNTNRSEVSSAEKESINIADGSVKVPDEPEAIKSDKNDSESLENLITKDKGDLVVVAMKPGERISPASSHKEGSNDEEWEKDFDLDVTEEEIKNAQKNAKESTEPVAQEGDDDWENW